MGILAENIRRFHPMHHCKKSLSLCILLRTNGVAATTADMPLTLTHGARAVFVFQVNRKAWSLADD